MSCRVRYFVTTKHNRAMNCISSPKAPALVFCALLFVFTKYIESALVAAVATILARYRPWM